MLFIIIIITTVISIQFLRVVQLIILSPQANVNCFKLTLQFYLFNIALQLDLYNEMHSFVKNSCLCDFTCFPSLNR